MGKIPNARLLLVEGQTDSRVLCEIFEKATGIPWETRTPANEKQFLIDIKACGSDGQLLEQIEPSWKESGRKFVGLVIDADTDPLARWIEVRNRAPREFRDQIPVSIPHEPFVHEVSNGRKFGVWIMPNNELPGMLETFLGKLRTSMPQSVGQHIHEAMDTAKRLLDQHARENPNDLPRISSWKEVHRSKAEIHTWLAWRDPPGEQLHEAVKHEALNIHAPLAEQFVGWMRRLYGL